MSSSCQILAYQTKYISIVLANRYIYICISNMAFQIALWVSNCNSNMHSLAPIRVLLPPCSGLHWSCPPGWGYYLWSQACNTRRTPIFPWKYFWPTNSSAACEILISTNQSDSQKQLGESINDDQQYLQCSCRHGVPQTMWSSPCLWEHKQCICRLKQSYGEGV